MPCARCSSLPLPQLHPAPQGSIASRATPADPLADLTNRGRGLAVLLPPAGPAGERGETQQKKRGRQQWKPRE